MIGRTNVGGGAGGAGGGATLVISSPANVSVTVSKDDKSYTKNSGSLGSTTFKGLATGTWTVTISGNGQTATRTIEITADYAITIAFFSATINITYPANSTCVVTNSSGQTVASDINATSSEKTFTATVNATGTYTVTATATDGSGNTKFESVEITSEGQSVSVALNYRTYLFKEGEGIANNWGVAGNGSLDKKDDNAIIIRSTAGFGGNNNHKAYILADLSEYKTLKAEIETTVAGKAIVGVFGTAKPTLYTGLSSSTSAATNGIREVLSLDISSFSGEQYVGIHVGNLEKLTMYNFWLE